jgi:hypothetical protein
MDERDRTFFESMRRAIDALSEEPYLEYWRELGQFIQAFSDAEYHLISLLRKYANLDEAAAWVLLSGTRLTEAKDQLYSLLEVTNQKKLRDRLDRPLGQLAAINKIRNHLLHWVARFDGSPDLLVSNAFLSPSKEKLKEFRIKPEHLRQMRQDLYRITGLLMMLEATPSAPSEELDSYLVGPWLYKPPQPSRGDRANPLGPPKPKRQPLSSRQRREAAIKKQKK